MIMSLTNKYTPNRPSETKVVPMNWPPMLITSTYPHPRIADDVREALLIGDRPL